MKKLLITDLDDTLYSWLEFFIPSFYAMLDKVCEITKIDRSILINEYKQLHQKNKTVEYPFLTLNLPSINVLYSDKNNEEIKQILSEAFHSFNSERKKRLKLYDGVKDTIIQLHDNGICIVGYTEATLESGYYRLKKLGIDKYFSHVFVSESSFSNPVELVQKVTTLKSKKPDEHILLEICNKMGFTSKESIYIGDSLTKDILMAILANVTSVWANYPKNVSDYYQKLIDITSWTDEDFANENKLKKLIAEKELKPDYEIHNFKDLLKIIM